MSKKLLNYLYNFNSNKTIVVYVNLKSKKIKIEGGEYGNYCKSSKFNIDK